MAYDLTVTNPSTTTGLVYNLADAPAFPAGVTITEPTASVVRSNVDGSSAGSPVVITGWNPDKALVEQKLLPAGSKDTYRITMLAAVPEDLSTSVLACSGEVPQHGYFNVGVAVSGDDTLSAHACGPIVPPSTPVVPTTPATPVPVTTPVTPVLSNTGVNVAGISTLAFTLLAAGALLMGLGFRRRRGTH